MRVHESIHVDAEPEEIWEIVTDPTRQVGLVAGVTRWDIEGDKERGIGARYGMRMLVGSAEIGSTIEVVDPISACAGTRTTVERTWSCGSRIRRRADCWGRSPIVPRRPSSAGIWGSRSSG
jgi:hypothetical protein